MRPNCNAVRMPTEEKEDSPARGALLCVADAGLAERLTREIELCAEAGKVSIAANMADLIEQVEKDSPRVILLDDELLEGAPVFKLLRQLTKGAAVILLAAAERQAEILPMVAEGKVEFVPRHGEFIPLAACLVERRLRWAQPPPSSGGSPWAEMPDDVAEIFRHEINNPLTGILGNAELLLSHGMRLPAADTQRLQTVVDLAVRLRETIRRLSDAWDSQTRLAKSSAPRSASGVSLV
ncbi:MAG TPA: histidine kinase dimerization/phospho-acceptor domain-containing protein [Candidatus Acidoferrales bacterium]